MVEQVSQGLRPQLQASFLFDRWPRYASRHPRRVLLGALIAVVAFGALFFSIGGTFGEGFSDPGTESQRLRPLLEERFPQTAGDSVTVLVRAPAGLEDGEVRARVEVQLSAVLQPA